jgi:hypothetical protein
MLHSRYATLLLLALASISPAYAQSPADVDQALDGKAQAMHQTRIATYQRLKGKLETAVDSSTEARNNAVGSALQMLAPVTDVKVQQSLMRSGAQSR